MTPLLSSILSCLFDMYFLDLYIDGDITIQHDNESINWSEEDDGLFWSTFSLWGGTYRGVSIWALYVELGTIDFANPEVHVRVELVPYPDIETDEEPITEALVVRSKAECDEQVVRGLIEPWIREGREREIMDASGDDTDQEN